MNPEEERTIPVQAADADLQQPASDPVPDTNAQAQSTQDFSQNPNAAYGAGMNAGYTTGANQANAPFNNAQGYQQNPNAAYGAGMNTGFNAGANQANAQFNNAQGYQQNPNAPYGGAQSFTQGFQNMTGTGNTGYNTGANQTNTQYNGAQGYQQNPNAQGYQNPYYVNPASIPNAAPAKKSKKKIWIPIVSVALVAVIAIGVCILLFSGKKTRNPEEVITSAMSNTFSAERTSSTTGWLHSQELDALAQGDAYQMSANWTIDEVSGSLADDISMLEGFGISTSMELDKDAERFAVSGDILYDGTKYLDYELYAYGDYMAIACPSLFEGYIEFKTSNFGVDFNNSPLAQALDTTIDPTIAFRFFELLTTTQETETEIPRELQEFFDAIRYEEGDKKDLQVNGKTQTCQGYNIVITRESMENLARWFCDYADSLGTPVEYSEISPILPREDLVMTVYVDNKGRMARFSFDFPLDYVQAELSCQIDFTGLNDNPADHVTGAIKLTVEGYAYGFSFESNTTTTGSTETQNTKMSIDVSGISIANANYTSTFDTQSKKGHADLSVSAMYTSLLTMNIDYSYTDVVPGERFTVNMDDLTLDVAGELTIGLSGSFSVSKLSGSVSEPSGTKYDLFTLTENDIETLGEEMMQNAMNGPLGFLFVEMLYDGYYFPDDDDWYSDDWNDDDWY